MKNFSNKDIENYLRKNFTSVDGLWFLKIEETLGFEKALEIDKEVWKVLPKIQARFIKEKLEEKFLTVKGGKEYYQNRIVKPDENHDSIKDLYSHRAEEFFIDALKIKMGLDNFKFKLLKKPGLVKAVINQCPWHEIMLRSNRVHLSGKVGSAICSTEYAVFASEFFKNSSLKINSQICSSGKTCVFELGYPV